MATRRSFFGLLGAALGIAAISPASFARGGLVTGPAEPILSTAIFEADTAYFANARIENLCAINITCVSTDFRDKLDAVTKDLIPQIQRIRHAGACHPSPR